jgi:4-hydroxyphenylpyruvate dioxygenase
MPKESLGIKQIESVHYYVHDLERSRRFYTQMMDFAEIGGSSPELTRAGREQSLAFAAGKCVVVCISPQGEDGRAARYLRKHPDGIGTINFEVEDARRTFELLERRGGTPVDEVTSIQGEGGRIHFFSIATPFGDTTFRFIQRDGFKPLYPGFEPAASLPATSNALGFEGFDHVTSNFQTMSPALLWMEHVLGLERYWEIQFHTTDMVPDRAHGSGLRSIVMHDPVSGVKFANNEPWRPFFKSSQINIFTEQHRGDGVQHLALGVKDIIPCVREMRRRNVAFMPTPGTYYDALPDRIKEMGLERIDEDLSVLRELEILVDGDKGGYLLQIFLKEAAGLYADPKAGPFFYEIIQRKGDEGFGAGNFRALFESIERQQA